MESSNTYVEPGGLQCIILSSDLRDSPPIIIAQDDFLLTMSNNGERGEGEDSEPPHVYVML